MLITNYTRAIMKNQENYYLSEKIGCCLFAFLFLFHSFGLKAQENYKTEGGLNQLIEIQGVKINFSMRGNGTPVLLIHGWPQTMHEWEKISPELSKFHTVITLDLPGFGRSTPSLTGYSKRALASYIHAFIKALKLKEKTINIVGHDIGGQVAYAYARMYGNSVSKLVIIEVPVPGLDGWEERKYRLWHFGFHQQLDLPETLVQYNVPAYLNYFFQRAYNKTAMDQDEVGPYISSYSNPDTLHAGFELYRAFDQDVKDNMGYDKEKLKMPVLAIGGEHSLNTYVYDQLKNSTVNLQAAVIKNSAHWVPEEQPDLLAKRLIQFLAD